MINASIKPYSINKNYLLRTLVYTKLIALYLPLPEESFPSLPSSPSSSTVSDSTYLPPIEVEDFLTVFQVLITYPKLPAETGSAAESPISATFLNHLINQFKAQQSAAETRAKRSLSIIPTSSSISSVSISSSSQPNTSTPTLETLANQVWQWKQRGNSNPYPPNAPILTCCACDINALTMFVGSLAAQIFPQPILQFLKTIVEKESLVLKPLNTDDELARIFNQTLKILNLVFTKHADRFVLRKQLPEPVMVRVTPSPSPTTLSADTSSPSPSLSANVLQLTANPASNTSSKSNSYGNLAVVLGAAQSFSPVTAKPMSNSISATSLQISPDDIVWCQEKEHLEIMANMLRAHINMLDFGNYYIDEQKKVGQYQEPTPSQPSSSSSSASPVIAMTTSTVTTSDATLIQQGQKEIQKKQGEEKAQKHEEASEKLADFKVTATDIAIMLDLTALRVRGLNRSEFTKELPLLWNYSCQTRILILFNKIQQVSPQSVQASPQSVMLALLDFTEKMYESAFPTPIPQTNDAIATSTVGQRLVVNYMEFISARTKAIIGDRDQLPLLVKITRLTHFTDELLSIYQQKLKPAVLSSSSSSAGLLDDSTAIQSNISTLNLVRKFWLSPHLHSFLDYCDLKCTDQLEEEMREFIYSFRRHTRKMLDITLNCLAYGHIDGARVVLQAVLQSNTMLNLQVKFNSPFPPGFMCENDLLKKGRKFIFPFFAVVRKELIPSFQIEEGVDSDQHAWSTNEFLTIFLRSITSIMSQMVESVIGGVGSHSVPTNSTFFQNLAEASVSIVDCISFFDKKALNTHTLANCYQYVQRCILSSQVTNWESRHLDSIYHLLGMIGRSDFYNYIPREKRAGELARILVLNPPNQLPTDWIDPTLDDSSVAISGSSVLFPAATLSSMDVLSGSSSHIILVKNIDTLIAQGGNDSERMQKLLHLKSFWMSDSGVLQQFCQYCATVSEKPGDTFYLSAKFMTDFIVKMRDFSLNCLALGDIESSLSAVKLILQHPCMLRLHKDTYSKFFPHIMPSDNEIRGQFKEFFDTMRKNFGLPPLIKEAIKRLDTNCISLRRNIAEDDIYIARFLREVSRMLCVMVDAQTTSQAVKGLQEIKQLQKLLKECLQNGLKTNINTFLDFLEIVQNYCRAQVIPDHMGSPLAFSLGMLYGSEHKSNFPYSIACLDGLSDDNYNYVPSGILSIDNLLSRSETSASSSSSSELSSSLLSTTQPTLFLGSNFSLTSSSAANTVKISQIESESLGNGVNRRSGSPNNRYVQSSPSVTISSESSSSSSLVLSSSSVQSPDNDSSIPPAPELPPLSDLSIPLAPPLPDNSIPLAPPLPLLSGSSSALSLSSAALPSMSQPISNDSTVPPENSSADPSASNAFLAEIQSFKRTHTLHSVSAAPNGAIPPAKVDNKRLPPPTGASGSGVPKGLSDALTRRKQLMESPPLFPQTSSSSVSIASGSIKIKLDTISIYPKSKPRMQVFDESSVNSIVGIAQQAEHNTFKFICGKDNQLFIIYYQSKGASIKRKAPVILIDKLTELFPNNFRNHNTLSYENLFAVINGPENNSKINCLEDFLCGSDEKVNSIAASIAASISARRSAISSTQDDDNECENDEHYGAPVLTPKSVVASNSNAPVLPQISDENAPIGWEGSVSTVARMSPSPASSLSTDSPPLLSVMSLLAAAKPAVSSAPSVVGSGASSTTSSSSLSFSPLAASLSSVMSSSFAAPTTTTALSSAPTPSPSS